MKYKDHFDARNEYFFKSWLFPDRSIILSCLIAEGHSWLGVFIVMCTSWRVKTHYKRIPPSNCPETLTLYLNIVIYIPTLLCSLSLKSGAALTGASVCVKLWHLLILLKTAGLLRIWYPFTIPLVTKMHLFRCAIRHIWINRAHYDKNSYESAYCLWSCRFNYQLFMNTAAFKIVDK